MSVKVKMKSSGTWNVGGEHKVLEEGEIYKLPVRCAAEICDNGYGEYTKKKEKPVPEENKAIEPEENKAAPSEEPVQPEEAPEPKKETPAPKSKKKKAAKKSKK